ncbi:hypothetical protein ACFQ7F_04940 [Streptomyces sp. NPDC056486]|uniref:hypothetical protein n=1 Tax=Streptomyces sp. NPDC056486 TaxID=3345835 RepID=UPI003675BAD8
MWPGQQPPGGEQNPQDQNPNPYQQPGYQQPNPYQQPGYQQQPHSGSFSQPEQPQWAAPTPPPMPPQPGGGGQGGGGNKTKVTAIVAAVAVLVAAGVTGFLVLGGDKDDEANGDPSNSPAKSASPKPKPSPTDDDGGGTERGTGGGPKPTIKGWQVVVNPKWGTAFDVPADWEVQTGDTFIGFEDNEKGDGSVLIGMSAPAYYKSKWCSSDDDKDGTTSDAALGAVGTKGQNGAKNTKDVARNDSAWWVFAGYTGQKKADKKKIKIGKAESFTTASGIKGSVVTSTTSGIVKEDKCDSNGKATTFAFKNSEGEYVAWSMYGAKGVKDEIPDATVQKILKTVRLNGDADES